MWNKFPETHCPPMNEPLILLFAKGHTLIIEFDGVGFGNELDGYIYEEPIAWRRISKMRVTLEFNDVKKQYVVSAQVEGTDNPEMHDDFARCIALFRGLDNKIVIQDIDLHEDKNMISVVFTCPYDYAYVKDGLNKHFTQHGFGIK